MAPSAIVEGPLGTIERIVGSRPTACPWRAFYDPLVTETLRAHRFFESGQLREFWGDDPPQILVDAIGCYISALSAIRAHDDAKRDRERREQDAANAAKAKRGQP